MALFSMFRGDRRPIVFQVVDTTTGAMVDVSTAVSIIFEIFDRAGDTKFSKSLDDGIAAVGNTITITPAPGDTDDLSGWYEHELEIRDADGGVHTTRGIMQAMEDHIR